MVYFHLFLRSDSQKNAFGDVCPGYKGCPGNKKSHTILQVKSTLSADVKHHSSSHLVKLACDETPNELASITKKPQEETDKSMARFKHVYLNECTNSNDESLGIENKTTKTCLGIYSHG